VSDTIIESERLVLRHWREEDRAPFAAMNADPDVMRHYPATLDREESDALTDRIIARIEQEGLGMWAMERKADGAFLGFTGFQFVPVPCPVGDDIEIGWRLGHEYWGQGYAREAALACLDWFSSNREEQRVIAMTIPDNTRSWGLMLRLGMRREEALDFDHPKIEAGSRCCHHIVYVKDRPF
jgi:RimJ/RimL family protein N-acetyltransferase